MKSFLKYSIASFALILLMGTSCQKVTDIEKETANEFKKKPLKPDDEIPSLLSVGDKAEGGIVFHVETYNGVQRGLVCTVSDLTTGKGRYKQAGSPWGCMGEYIEEGFNNYLGGGLENTELIAKQCKEGAAFLCSELILNGKEDWYLPNLEELKFIHNNFVAGRILRKQLGNLSQSGYWSSNQIDKDHADGRFMGPTFEYLRDNYDSWTDSSLEKTVAWRVRPVRKFGEWLTD